MSRKILQSVLLISFGVIVIIFAGSDEGSWQGQFIGYAALVVIGLPASVMLFLQICFWAYHWLTHGDPFYDPAVYAETRRDRKDGQRGIISLDMYTFSRKKMCPICKRMTRCKVYDGGKGGVPYHIHRQ